MQMKKVLIATLALCLLLGCSNQSEESAFERTQTSESEISILENSISESESESAVNPYEGTATSDIFAVFESGLLSLGIEYERVDMGAEMVGALQGVKYKLPDGNVELYMFDANSDSLKVAAEKQAITLEGFGDFSANINGNYALMIEDVAQKDEILDLFQKIT